MLPSVGVFVKDLSLTDCSHDNCEWKMSEKCSFFMDS